MKSMKIIIALFICCIAVGEAMGSEASDAVKGKRLIAASKSKDDAIINNLLADNYIKLFINTQDDDGSTALMHIARAGNKEMIAQFLSKGANKDLFDLIGDQAADYARKANHEEVAKALDTLDAQTAAAIEFTAKLATPASTGTGEMERKKAHADTPAQPKSDQTSNKKLVPLLVAHGARLPQSNTNKEFDIDGPLTSSARLSRIEHYQPDPERLKRMAAFDLEALHAQEKLRNS